MLAMGVQFSQTHLRRVCSANLGKDGCTEKEDTRSFFESNCDSLAHLARNDEQKLKDGDDQDDALARRSEIFVVIREADLRIDIQAMEDARADILAREQQNRDQAC